MQMINPTTKNNSQLSFRMRVSKLGHQIDKVLEQRGLYNNEIERLRVMLGEYFLSPNLSRSLVGEGFHGRVYSIDDKYVFKCKNRQSPDAADGAFLMTGGGGSPLTGLKTYFGGILMQLGNVKILRNVSSDGKHMPAGIPRVMLGEVPKNELIDYYNNKYLPTFANLPQRSFDRLAGDFACLNKKGHGYYGLEFDTNNPNNIVLVGTSTMRIVDDINETMKLDPNRVAGLLDMFLKKANTTMLAPITEENRPLRFELFKKIILAGEKYELPLTSGTDYDKNVWNMVCDFGKTGEQIRLKLFSLRAEKNKSKRLQNVNDYLNSMGK